MESERENDFKSLDRKYFLEKWELFNHVVSHK